jgi:ribose transport system substrate-binding protein
MKRRLLLSQTSVFLSAATCSTVFANLEYKKFVYIAPSLRDPFWRYVSSGVRAEAKKLGYSFEAFDSNNDALTQLKNVQTAIARGVSGIVISPTDSSTAPNALKLAKTVGIPVAIADIGTTEGDYITLISSNNLAGARGIGQVTAEKLKDRKWINGSFGIIGIPQTRINGQFRTQGFRESMKNVGMTKETPLLELQTFSTEEISRLTQGMLDSTPDLRAIFVQTDSAAVTALRTVKAAKRENSLLIAAFDANLDLVKLIRSGEIVGSGMQQPYLMGSKAALSLADHIAGKAVEKNIQLSILIATTENISRLGGAIALHVFAGELK